MQGNGKCKMPKISLQRQDLLPGEYCWEELIILQNKFKVIHFFPCWIEHGSVWTPVQFSLLSIPLLGRFTLSFGQVTIIIRTDSRPKSRILSCHGPAAKGKFSNKNNFLRGDFLNFEESFSCMCLWDRKWKQTFSMGHRWQKREINST